MEDKIEHIIRNNKYFELNQEEKEIIKEWASNEAEFDQLKAVFVSLNEMHSSANESLNPTIKQRLDVRFKEKYNERRLVWYNKLWLFLWPQDVSIVRKPLLQLTAVGIIVAVISPFLFVEDPSTQTLAMNEKKAEVEELQSESDKTVNKPEQEPKTESLNTEKIGLKKKDAKNEQQIVNQEDNITQDNNLESSIKDLEMSAPRETVIDETQMDKTSTLADELAESEPLTESYESLDEEVTRSSDQVFAGAISKSEIQKTSASTVLDSDQPSGKRVKAEETIELLTALY